MKIIQATILAAFAAALYLVVPENIQAQGRYADRYSRADVDNIIRRMEDSGDEFRRDFNTELDRSGMSSSQKRTYRNQVNDFENATDRLRGNFNNNNSWWSSRNQVQDVVSNSRPLNTTMNIIAFRRRIERQWNRLRNDINTLADTFDLPGINGGGWTGGGGGGGGQQGLVPNWAQGTFYARNPQTGGTITMVIDRSGQVTLVFDGGVPTYASMYRTTLTNGPYVSRVSRLNNGIRTTDVSNRSYIDYYRTPIGGGQVGNVPTWATGTFFGRDQQSGGTIELTILRNGNVTIIHDGGAPVYATMNGTTLTNGPYVSRVTRLNNGIRTTDVANGSYIDYFRR